jgi:ParB family transcriptional regulator, chromosome partitioning protein
VSSRIEEISISEFDLSLSGMRIMNMTRILQVEKSMRLHGQLQPVVARVHERGYQLIDGFKRFYAAEDLMMDALQCRVLEIDVTGAKVLLLTYNRLHQSMEAWEEAMVLQDLQKTHCLTQCSLAHLTGYSRSWVSRRLALIGKMDEDVSSGIMMGTLTSSHARALTKLPRGNQGEVARAITNFALTSRQSDKLVEAFLKAGDENQQRYILSHPEHILRKDLSLSEEDVYDVRLSSYGNDLMQSIGYVIQAVQVMCSSLDDQRMGILSATERVIITPGLQQVMQYCKKLTASIAHLQIHKSEATR